MIIKSEVLRATSLLLTAALGAMSASAPAQRAGATSPDADRAAIEAVRVKFDKAIRAQDLPALQGLFYEGSINWRATGEPASRKFMSGRTGKPAPAVEVTGADQIIGKPEYKALRLEERFGPATIVTDGQLATATFNYDFRANEQIQNWGTESWQLARTDDGWRIVNLMYSYRFQAVSPEPPTHLTTVASASARP